jgi:UDP:flavonoid glycosyltransferase YjiC (YdhE family)
MDILPLSSLFIMNGGTGGSRESCWFGVPMLAIPTTFETECVSLQMQKMGAGLVLDKKCTELELSKTINKLLQNSSYADRSRYIGDQCKKSGGAQRAADLILSHVKYKNRIKTHA